MNEQNKRLVEENMKLVYHVINTYYPNHIGDEDLEQEGFIGLCRAAEKFDDTRDAKFSTFACSTIHNYLRHYFTGLSRQKRTANLISLDLEIKHDDGSGDMLHEVIEDKKADTLFKQCEIENFIDELDDREREIVKLRREGLTDEEIGERLGLSRGYINLIVRTMRKRWRKEYGD